jgi:ubiquitin carboxyl-terminal hydrolase L3
MNALASKLGLSDKLKFYDVWTIDEPELLYHIPRPCHALLVIIPFTEAWDRDRRAEDAKMEHYDGMDGSSSEEPPVIWFKQTIGNACGSIGLLHCAINGAAKDFILPGSTLEKIRADALDRSTMDRAQMLYDNQEFEDAHASVAAMGDTKPPSPDAGHLGQHFVAFVRGKDGHLWELEGSRKGPIDRGVLLGDEDVLSSRALAMGLKRVIKVEQDAGGDDLRFSCIALASAFPED